MAIKKFKAKKYRVAVEGATTDGRKIERKWIEDMAATYDPAVYGARINMEHIKSYHPDSVFRAYGDVLSVHAEEVEIQGVKKLALFAELDPTEELIALNKKRQKVFTSIEVHPDFAGTGKAYLMGVAITDDPASLGTEMLEFASKANTNPLNGRKKDPACLFTAAEEIQLNFEEEQETLTEKFKALFKKSSVENSAALAQFKTDVEGSLTLMAEEVVTLGKTLAETAENYKTLQQKHAALQQDHDQLKAQLDSTPQHNYQRPPASGNDTDAAKTDC